MQLVPVSRVADMAAACTCGSVDRTDWGDPIHARDCEWHLSLWPAWSEDRELHSLASLSSTLSWDVLSLLSRAGVEFIAASIRSPRSRKPVRVYYCTPATAVLLTWWMLAGCDHPSRTATWVGKLATRSKHPTLHETIHWLYWQVFEGGHLTWRDVELEGGRYGSGLDRVEQEVRAYLGGPF